MAHPGAELNKKACWYQQAFLRFSRQLKNTHLQRCARPSSLRRTMKCASFLNISRALHLNVFDQPVKK
jgi:hypothetical protein